MKAHQKVLIQVEAGNFLGRGDRIANEDEEGQIQQWPPPVKKKTASDTLSSSDESTKQRQHKNLDRFPGSQHTVDKRLKYFPIGTVALQMLSGELCKLTIREFRH